MLGCASFTSLVYYTHIKHYTPFLMFCPHLNSVCKKKRSPPLFLSFRRMCADEKVERAHYRTKKRHPRARPTPRQVALAIRHTSNQSMQHANHSSHHKTETSTEYSQKKETKNMRKRNIQMFHKKQTSAFPIPKHHKHPIVK